MNERGVSIIEHALRLSGESVRPIYRKEDCRLASLWMGDRAFLLVNWEDEAHTLTLDCISRPFTADKPFTRAADGRLTVTLRAHESFAGFFTED